MRLRLFTRTDSQTTRKTIAIYAEQMKIEQKSVVTAAICIPLGNFLFAVLLPFFISLLTQSLIEHPHNFRTPLILLGAMALTSVATIIVNHFGFISLFNQEERITTRLLEKAMRGLLAHSHGFFANQKVGSLAGDANTFSRSYLQIFDVVFLQASSIIVNFITSLIIIGFMTPIMVIPLIATTLFVVIHSLRSLESRSYLRNKRKEMTSKLFGTVADVLGNHTIVRVFGMEKAEVTNIVSERRAIEKVAHDEITQLQRTSEVRQGVLAGLQILIFLLTVVLFGRHMLSIGALIFIITYLGRIVGSMFNITSIIRIIEQAFLDAAKVTEILAITPDVLDHKNAPNLVVKSAAIDFRNVNFAYADAADEPVFTDLTLAIPNGQHIGLVGHSGGGKTTLTSLLLRYSDIQAGSISISGQNIAEVTQASLRQAISYVPQDTYLFHRTLRENIAYGSPDVNDDALWDVLKKANAYDFVHSMPRQLDTIVGERGVKLSGGQRQRIAIARAILKDAPILVLDEATSALDSESEKLIQDALEKLMVGRTSIVIAHRLSTIAKLDRIIVLDDGTITEDGTHRELVDGRGVYASLWRHQSGGFLEE
ncbi:MAG TPA: ABC transporter ATP-binding protein [Candidatus Saccharimonadaceae bacterium]|nr:ABC transporter ATP-binding protein [Candidatus Saccharimonadaceae bacterium]